MAIGKRTNGRAESFPTRLTTTVGVYVLVLFILGSCGGLTDLFSGKTDDKPTIPEDVLNLAEGIFDFIGPAVDYFDELHANPEARGPIPVGFSVDVNQENVIKINFEQFQPESGVTVNGSITITKLGSNPFKIELSGNLTITGTPYSSVLLNGTAEWASGLPPPDNEPKTVTGSITVDGKSYDLNDVLKALSEREQTGDSGGDGGGWTYPPAPQVLWGKSYYLIATRIPPAVGWVQYTNPSMNKLDINSNGTGWGLEGGTVAGYIYWSDQYQTLNLLDNNGTNILYALYLVRYTETEFYSLNSVWDTPEQQKDLYFNVDSGYPIENIR